MSWLWMAAMRLARSADFHLPASALPNISQTDSMAAFNCSNMVQNIFCDGNVSSWFHDII